MILPESLQTLVDDGVIDSVEARLMSGKEAAVFVAVRRGERIAAKVYKAREHRTFKATSAYTEGRNQTRNSRDKRAMDKRSHYGRELMEESWRDMEYQALLNAMYGGVRVPRPILLHDDVLLMQLLVDAEGEPAPRLADWDLEPEAAEGLFREIHHQVRLLLGTGKVHGDLSAFNILMAVEGPTLIDLPQVVDASGNNRARDILVRDLENVAEHLAKFDARLLRYRECGAALWHHFQSGSLHAAANPHAGSFRGGGGGGGRRAQLAERGRMGREGQRERRPDPRNALLHLDTTRNSPQPDARRGRGPRGSGRADVGAHPQGGPRRDDRPRVEGPRGDRPQGDRPRGDRAQGDRAQGDRPRVDGPRVDGPRGDRPRGDRPRGDRPHGDRSRGDGPDGARSHGMRAGDRPPGDRARGDRPPGDRPRGDRHGDRPRGDRPRDERSHDARPGQRGEPERRDHARPADAAGQPRRDGEEGAPRRRRRRRGGGGGGPDARAQGSQSSGNRAQGSSSGRPTRGRDERAPVQVEYVRRIKPVE